MKSAKLPLLIVIASLSTSCAVGRGVVVVPAAQTPCSKLVPEEWRNGVPGAALPTSAELTADPAQAWRTATVRESGQREKANDRTVDTLDIVGKCEARDREAAERLTERSLWQKITPWRE